MHTPPWQLQNLMCRLHLPLQVQVTLPAGFTLGWLRPVLLELWCGHSLLGVRTSLLHPSNIPDSQLMLTKPPHSSGAGSTGGAAGSAASAVGTAGAASAGSAAGGLDALVESPYPSAMAHLAEELSALCTKAAARGARAVAVTAELIQDLGAWFAVQDGLARTEAAELARVKAETAACVGGTDAVRRAADASDRRIKKRQTGVARLWLRLLAQAVRHRMRGMTSHLLWDMAWGGPGQRAVGIEHPLAAPGVLRSIKALAAQGGCQGIMHDLEWWTAGDKLIHPRLAGVGRMRPFRREQGVAPAPAPTPIAGANTPMDSTPVQRDEASGPAHAPRAGPQPGPSQHAPVASLTREPSRPQGQIVSAAQEISRQQGQGEQPLAKDGAPLTVRALFRACMGGFKEPGAEEAYARWASSTHGAHLHPCCCSCALPATPCISRAACML